MLPDCFHCGEKIPKGIDLNVKIDNIIQPMCCIGCESIATTIVDNNLTDYYRFRTEPAQKGEQLIPQQLKQNKLLDDESLQEEFTYKTDQFKETILTIDGISCAACAWLIEMQLSKENGIKAVNVNATTQRATVRWEDDKLKLSEILKNIDNIGYKALPFKASQVEESNQIQSKSFIKRLGISGILMMQVMMIAVGLYFGAFSGMSEHTELYLRWASMLLTAPIITYGAFPFYTGAINTLKMKRLSMDVPVSIAITLAFCASVWATISQQGEVYFESVSMFTFLLLIGKFLEFRARLKASHVSANLLKLMPMTATQLIGDTEEFVAAKKLNKFDLVLIKPGETVPADGTIVSGTSQLNEAMLSGEQLPVAKTVGDIVLAGTINGDGNLTVEVKKQNQDSFLSQMIRLSESSQAHKPKLAQLSDRIAQYFVAVILLTAIFTALYWNYYLPNEAFWITLSVLVATCPCALSLATPTALTCATVTLNKKGIMIKSGHAMETIPNVNCVAFDKTGTLTTGEFIIETVQRIDTDVSKSEVLALSAALEAHSEHPLAKAFVQYRDFSINMTDVDVTASSGVTGIHQNITYQIGKPSWLLPKDVKGYSKAQCVLTQNGRLIAAFYLTDSTRPDAIELIKSLKQKQIKTIMLSGDNISGCENVQSQLNLDAVHNSLTAQDKVNILKTQQQEHIVAMIGDGVNDTPVFGASHISIAMGNGTDIAKNGADVILLNSDLTNITNLKTIAEKTKQIIWQNYLWAFSYNAIVLPLAVMGYITPYMAVIGMSASSILVITNSLRLLKR
jgi:Cu2+-exporting ATPase